MFSRAKTAILSAVTAILLAVGVMAATPAQAGSWWTLYNDNVGNVCSSTGEVYVWSTWGGKATVWPCSNTSTWSVGWRGQIVKFQIPGGCVAWETRNGQQFKSGYVYSIGASNVLELLKVYCASSAWV